MKVITSINEIQSEICKQRSMSKTIGFVPTMGFLHEGHLTLIKEAREENDIVVLSIFVNPLQFGPNEDYATYPRDFERDRALAESEKVDYLFYPSVEEMYPQSSSVTVAVHRRTNVLCGKSRPGHFDGVATVITKLFNLVMPTRAYFGKKDAQQVAIIEGLITDLNIPVKIVPVDIVREKDGLAKSSRNVHLTSDDRKQAIVLYKSLQAAKKAIEDGERNPDHIVNVINDLISIAPNAKVDYVDILTYPHLEPLEKLDGRFIIALAVRFSNIRLIDNMIFEGTRED